MDQDNDLLIWSFVGLLVGGILILVGGMGGVGMMGFGGFGMGGMMASYAPAGSLTTMMWWMAAWSLATGAATLVAAANVRARRNVATWGTVGIVAGALSLLAMGGFLIGAVAAIAGGGLALASEGARGTPPRAPGA